MPTLSPASPATTEVRPLLDDLAYLRTIMVNLYLVGPPGAADRDWVLVDTGMAGSADQIVRAAAERFGPGSRPAAIVLTHGHFDHVGAVDTFSTLWDAPVFAHPLELPYLTGRSSYPPPDPSVGGGLVSALSWSFPRGPIDLGDRVKPLPEKGAVPGLPDWRWVFTPGHTPGHIALFRDADRALIAGDAVVTTRQESAAAVISQRRELCGPPRYFTPDWVAAARSVATLANLQPDLIATGHGVPLRGPAATASLRDLARDFHRWAMPGHGRYVSYPAEADGSGVVSLPPDVSDLLPGLLLGGNGTSRFVRELLGEDIAEV